MVGKYPITNEDNLRSIASFIQKLGHLGGLSTSGLSTYDDTGIFSDRLHDDLLLWQHRQLESSLLQKEFDKLCWSRWTLCVTVKKRRYNDHAQAHTCISGDLSTGTKIAGCEGFLLWSFSSPEVFFSFSPSFSTQCCSSITSCLFSWLDVVASVHSFFSAISLSSSTSSEDVSRSLLSSSNCSSSSSSSSFHFLFRCAPLMLLIFVPKSPSLTPSNILETIQNKTDYILSICCYESTTMFNCYIYCLEW